MIRMRVVIAAALLSAATLTWPLAQAQVSEPAAYQAAHPDRDVLNGGQLTPAGRAARGLSQEPSGAYVSQGIPTGAVRAVHPRRPRQHR